MKNLFILIICLSSFMIFAGEVTGAGKEIDQVLSNSNLSRAKLEQLGLKLGEVTGAGKIHVDALEMIVTSKEVISVDNIIHMDFKNPSSGQMVSEVNAFSTLDKTISKQNIKAYIYKK